MNWRLECLDPTGCPDETTPSPIGTALTCLVFLIVAYTSWARGGTTPKLQTPILIGGTILLAALVLLPALPVWRGNVSSRVVSAMRSFLTDPIAWAGLAFMALLAVQWWNSGRQPVFDATAGRWFFSPPPHPNLPSAFATPEAAEMIVWFLPAWAIALAVRSPWMDRRHVWGLLYALVANAAVLAVFGIVQFLSGTNAIYWTTPIAAPFFAAFGYINHGSAFFVLATSLSAALLMRECFGRRRRPRRWTVVALLAALMLNMIAAHLSFCRAGMVFVWIMALVVGIYSVRRARKDMPPVIRAYLAIGIVAVVMVALLAIAHMAYREIAAEISGGIGKEFSWRIYFLEGRDRAFSAAWRIWTDNFWFGVGGWGFSHLLALYVPQTLWSWVTGGGWANVHNDPLQFLVEFGLFGGALLAFAVIVMTIAIVRSGVWRRSAAVMMLTGCFLVWLHSLIDLPFRCPAILLSWTLLLAALPVLTSGSPRSCEPS